MRNKDEIVANWLPRYTGLSVGAFGHHILLTNFQRYVEMFAEWHGVPVVGVDRPMPSATAEGITIIDFSMGSANAATIMDLITAVDPLTVLFLGKCGAIKDDIKVGDLILPIAGIRGEGTSNDYLPPEVPALPAFALQKAVSSTITAHERAYFTGVVYTTNRRVWEHDEEFKAYLQRIRCTAIDMETATIFTVGFANHIPTGALLLVSDNPMVPEGVKTAESDALVNQHHIGEHLRIGIESLSHIMEKRQPVKHLRF
jgi:AMP nucleosidase